MAIISAIIRLVKEVPPRMIHYAPLWKTMKERQVTTYTLRYKYGMSHATVQRLQNNLSVTTYTLNKLCGILNCQLQDIAEYTPDGEILD